MTTTLIIVRHAEAEGNAKRIFHGQTDGALTEKGREQLAALVRKFECIDIDCIYSSDLIRAHYTAMAIARLKNLPVTTSVRLREVNAGKWENVSFEEIPKLFPEVFRLWENEPHLTVFPGGESIESFHKRSYSELMRIVKANAGKRILVVTHGTVLRAALCTFKGLGLECLKKVSWGDNTCITIVEFDEDWNPRIVVENDNSHVVENDLSTVMKQDWWLKQHDEEGNIKQDDR